MPKIEILELDETTAGVTTEETDVVYIPGFVDTTQASLQRNVNGEYQYIGIETNKPTLFTSVKQFESLCGKRPATFKSKQKYTDLQENSTEYFGYTGFSANATPYHKIMFEEGASDPSYIMAKEYLSAGLHVLYERVNGSGEYVELTKKPSDWDYNYNKYFIEQEVYEHITDTTPPLWYKIVEENATVQPDVNYYTATYQKDELGNDTKIIESFVKAELEVGSFIDDSQTYFIYTNQHYYEKVIEKSGSVSYKDITIDNSGLMKAPPIDWVKVYYDHYRLFTNAKVNIEMTTPVPEFDSFDKVFELSDGINIKTMYDALEGIYNSEEVTGLVDKGNYPIKYLTSGGYPVYEYSNNVIAVRMIALAKARGDCVAFIDHSDRPDREDNIDLNGSLYNTVVNDTIFKNGGDFATMFTPYAIYNRTTIDKDDYGKTIKQSTVRMPASFAYFMALGNSLRTNANWLAIAGSARGTVLNLTTDGMTTNIPNGAADKMQPRDDYSINPITNIKPYGWTIWGNRTLKDNAENNGLTATSFLNVRNLISDVKKLVYRTARKLTFEQNNDILWVNFKSEISPTLDRMKTGYGISDYKILRDMDHEKAIEKATICAKIILYPVYPVEDFYITVVLKDDEISVE